LGDSETIEKIKNEYHIEPDTDLILIDIFKQIEKETISA
jgi:hypothetical protein